MDYNYMDHQNQPPLPGSQYGHQARQQLHHVVYQQEAAADPRTHHTQQMPYAVNVHVAPFRPLGIGQSPPDERGFSRDLHREQPLIAGPEVQATLNQSSNQLHRILTGNQPQPGIPAVMIEQVNRQTERTVVTLRVNDKDTHVFAPLESDSQHPRVTATGVREIRAPSVDPDVSLDSSATIQVPDGPGVSNVVLSPTSPDAEPHIQATQLEEPSEGFHGANASHEPQDTPPVQSPEPPVPPSQDVETTQVPSSPMAPDNRPSPSSLYLAPTLPDGLSYQYSKNEPNKIMGVVANKCLEGGVQFGPFKGHLVTDISSASDSSTWELCLDGRVVSYVSANNNQANWMVHVRGAQNEEERNLEAVQQYGRIYFVTTQAIQTGSELTVFYSEEYRENCGFTSGLANLNHSDGSNSFSCDECQCSCTSAKGLLRHIKATHKVDETHDFTAEVALIPSETSKLVSNSRNLVPKQPQQLISLEATRRFICTTCGKHFPTQGRLIAHESFHEETEADLTDGEYNCEKCGFECPSETSLAEHLSLHETSPFGCDECGRCYTQQKYVYRHKREKHGLGLLENFSKNPDTHKLSPWECDECGRSYTTLKILKRHKREKHTHKILKIQPPAPKTASLQCDECDRRYTKRKYLNFHKRQKHGMAPYVKNTTPQNSVLVEKLDAPMIEQLMLMTQNRPNTQETSCNIEDSGKPVVAHMKAALQHKILKIQPPAPKTASLQCDECDRRYTKRKYLNSHKRQKHGMAPYVKGTTQNVLDAALLEQLMLMKENHDKESSSDQPVDMLGKQVNYFTKPHPFKCKLCPRRFLDRYRLLNHEVVAHGREGKYKCSFCPKSFMLEKRLLVHLQLHTDGHPFKCALCPRSFASQSAHDNHQGEHTGAKPYKCDTCGRGFATPKLLRKHKARLHRQGEKRFGCSFCEKRFAERGDLKRHEQRHKGIRPFVCLTCGKGFTGKHCLEVHKRSHTGEKPFVCKHCSKEFAYNQHLTDHLMMHARQQQEGTQMMPEVST